MEEEEVDVDDAAVRWREFMFAVGIEFMSMDCFSFRDIFFFGREGGGFVVVSFRGVFFFGRGGGGFVVVVVVVCFRGFLCFEIRGGGFVVVVVVVVCFRGFLCFGIRGGRDLGIAGALRGRVGVSDTDEEEVVVDEERKRTSSLGRRPMRGSSE